VLFYFDFVRRVGEFTAFSALGFKCHPQDRAHRAEGSRASRIALRLLLYSSESVASATEGGLVVCNS
jgi:hypothetical protein